MKKIILFIVLNSLCIYSSLSIPNNKNVNKIKMPVLRTILLDMAKKDQEIRYRIENDSKPTDNLILSMKNADQNHTESIKKIFNKYGWPKSTMVGYDGVFAFWLLAQHTPDSDFQRTLLPHVERAFKEGELDAQSYALFVDRLLVREGKPQKYGTQIKTYVNKKAILFPIENPSNIDIRRVNIGLVKLHDYLSIVNNLDRNNKIFFTEEYETKHDGWIGIEIDIKGGREIENMTVRTLTVSNVIKGSAAEKAGIQIHDRIIAIDGVPVAGSKVYKLFAAMDKPVGDSLALVLKQLDGSKKMITVVIESAQKHAND